MIYIICFTFSCFIAYCSSFFNKHSGKLILLVGFLVTCLLAGLRSVNIGTDIQWYALPLFNNAVSCDSIFELTQTSWLAPNLAYIYASNIEPMFLFVTYLLAKTGFGFNFYLFIIQLLIEIPLFLALMKFCKQRNTNFALVAALLYFSCFIFNYSLNLMRQFIATSFFILSFTYFRDRKYVRFLFLFLISLTFHRSAIICLSLILIYVIVTANFFNNLNNKTKFLILFLFLAISLIFILYGTKFLYFFLVKIGSKYASYLDGSVAFSINQFIVRLPLIIFYLIYFKKISVKNSRLYFFFLAALFLDLVVSQLSTLGNAYRLSYYFMSFNLLAVFYFFQICNKKKVLICFLLFIIYCVVYWIYYFYLGNSGETLPYKFFWSV